MATHNLSSLFSRLQVSSAARPAPTALLRPATLVPTVRQFTTTPCPSAKAAPSKNNKAGRKSKKEKEVIDPRIQNLKLSIPRKVPAPLRFARNRHLRHWTIHRAWLLWQRQEREREERELMRMYQSMGAAAEELRKTSGPGLRDEGYLYRLSMEKKGLFGHKAIPIEYARPQTETPARTPWNHEWTR